MNAAAESDESDTLWTIGHSTRAWPEFVDMLHAAGILTLVDVRRFAGSRRNPQFSGVTMARALPQAGIDYLPMPELGGRRKPLPDSRNDAWRNDSFRGYADYMLTPDWLAARERLATLARAQPTAIMCAEAPWWRCHRSLIADAFKARGWQVVHLMTARRSEPHPYTQPARIVDGELTYAAPPEPQGQLPL